MMVFLPKHDGIISPRYRAGLLFLDSKSYSAMKLEGTIEADIVIVGAGPSAVSFLSNLGASDLESLKKTVVIDREGEYCARFINRCNALGQTTLRSPYEHHLGSHRSGQCELLDIGKLLWRSLTTIERQQVRLAQMSERSVVPLDVWEAHTAHLVSVLGLNSLIRKGEVTSVTDFGDHCIVEGKDFNIRANVVVIATGERTASEELVTSGQALAFDRRAVDQLLESFDELFVEGKGLSAAYIIDLLISKEKFVKWVCRSEISFQCSDVNSRFFRPEGRSEYQLKSHEERLLALNSERRASIMYEFYDKLHSAVLSGQVVIAEPGSLSKEFPGVLAHGTIPESPEVIVQGRKAQEIDIWRNKIFLTDPQYRLIGSERVFALGVHGSWTGGPAGRNFDGMRVASEIIVDSLRRGVRT